jgi:hypothetical protein
MASKIDYFLILCSRPNCFRLAVVPPEGYSPNIPVCNVHIERWDSLLYDEEIRKLWEDNPEQHKKSKCRFCGFLDLREHTAKMPCCGAYTCCSPSARVDILKPVLYCTKCGDYLALSVEERGRTEKYYPVRWFAPWKYVEEISRNSPFSKHHGHLDVYKVAYEKMIEKGMKIAEEIEGVKFRLGEYRMRTDPDFFYNVVDKYEEDFDTLYRCYQDLLIQLGVNPKITPAFVPTVVRSAFYSLSSGDSETTSQ